MCASCLPPTCYMKFTKISHSRNTTEIDRAYALIQRDRSGGAARGRPSGKNTLPDCFHPLVLAKPSGKQTYIQGSGALGSREVPRQAIREPSRSHFWELNNTV